VHDVGSGLGIRKAKQLSVQIWDTGLSGGIPNFKTLVSMWILKKIIKFQTLYAHIQITQKSSSYTNKEGSWTSTNLDEIERLIAFLVYAGLVKV
jgi:hypothetical protein